MEAGKAVVVDGVAHAPTDLITAISASASPQVDDDGLTIVERSACPTCGSCSGMFTANSMNCLTEALGLALPGNGSTLATHAAPARAVPAGGPDRHGAGHALVRATTTRRALPAHRSPRGRPSRTRWRSTSPWAARPTPCCTSSPPRRRARSTSTWPRSTPSPGACRAWPRWRPTPTTTWRTSTGRAASRRSSASCGAAGLLNADVHTVHSPSLEAWLDDVGRPGGGAVGRGGRAVPRRAGRGAHHRGVLDGEPLVARSTPTRRAAASATSSTPTPTDGGLAVLRGNIAPDGAVIKTAGHRRGAVALRGPGAGRREPGGGRLGDPGQAGAARRRAGGALRGPVRRAGDAGDAAPHRVPQGRRARPGVRADHRRPVLRRLQSASRWATSRRRPRRAA